MIAGGSLAIVVGIGFFGLQSWKYSRKVEEKPYIEPEKNTLPSEEEGFSLYNAVDQEKVSSGQGQKYPSPLKRHKGYTKLPNYHNFSKINEQRDKQVGHSPPPPKDKAKDEEKTDEKYPSTSPSQNSMNQEEEEIKLIEEIREAEKKRKEQLEQEFQNAKLPYDKNLCDFALQAKVCKEELSDKSYANAVQMLALTWLLERAEKKLTDIGEETNIKKTKDRSTTELLENFKKAQEESNSIKEKLDIATKKYEDELKKVKKVERSLSALIENDQN